MLKTPARSLLPCKLIREEVESGKDLTSPPPYKSPPPSKADNDEPDLLPLFLLTFSSNFFQIPITMLIRNRSWRCHWSQGKAPIPLPLFLSLLSFNILIGLVNSSNEV